MKQTTTLVFLFVSMAAVITCRANISERAGAISYYWMGNNTIRATITTYSNLRPDQDSMPISWGDGMTDTIARVSIYPDGDSLPNNLRLNYYQGTHTYTGIPSSGFTVISMSTPNRYQGIVNIGNSVNVPFYIEDTIWFANQTTSNYGPTVLYPPFDIVNVSDTFFYNPAAYDVEADSLTFEFAMPLEAPGMVAPGYVSPDAVITGPSNTINIDKQTGEIIWSSPQYAAIYDIAILIREYKDGNVVSTMEQDMIIDVSPDTIQLPRLHGVFQDTVITVGSTLSLPYSGTADASYTDSLSVYGGIFLLASHPASFAATSGATAVSGSLNWTPGPNQYKPRETRIVAIRSQEQTSPPYSNIQAFRVTVVDSSFATSIAEIAGIADMVIYPVPAYDKLYTNITLSIAGTSITDMMGRQWEVKADGSQIDISGLAPGIYLLRTENKGQTFIKRFIKE